MKKYKLFCIQIIFLIPLLYLCYSNMSNMSDINIIKNSNLYTVNTTYVILCAYCIGLFAGIIQSFINKNNYKSQIEFYSRKNEKLLQQNEIDSDDKEALQRKIASLEIALKNALNNK